jgi:hypothetical protein
MRGKKTDTEFVSNFIEESINNGLTTPEDFLNRAKSMISSIDEEIKRVEKQKIVRSKLLDVIATFEAPNKVKKQEDAKILSFYQIEYPQVCRAICRALQKGTLTIDQIMEDKELSANSSNVVFCLKQLMEHKVISKVGNHFLRSDKFDLYLNFVLRENI